MDVVARRPRRPVGVTIAVVLIYVQAVLEVIAGTVLVLARYGVDPSDSGAVLAVTLLGCAVILFGLFLIAVASGIARGSRFSRWIVTALLALSLSANVVTLIVGAGEPWWTVIDGLIAIAILLVLWTGRGRRYFRESVAPTVDEF
ncbi:hypothetical protein WJX64_06005 [Leifsonia sp. YIM 134122]|uniref:DUF7144 domain-containing protein n=1 Tax=Leifsonia stereocauli TaxID=3134136 RepID=A0ABU9W277_9MICO